MTNPPPPPPPPSPSPDQEQPRKRRTGKRVARMPLGLAVRRTIVASIVFAALVFAGLTLQMTRGDDPALGSQAVTNPQDGAGPTSLVESDDYGDDDDDDDDDDDEVGSYIAPDQAPAPAPVQTQAS